LFEELPGLRDAGRIARGSLWSPFWESRGMNIAIGSLNYDIILQVERMPFEHEKLSLFVTFGCRVDAVRAP
jgi:hypothetical protein